jgi:hypothetical protein
LAYFLYLDSTPTHPVAFGNVKLLVAEVTVAKGLFYEVGDYMLGMELSRGIK